MMQRYRLFSATVFILFWACNAQGSEPPEGYVGSETCMDCHEDRYASYMTSRHAVKGDPRTPAAKHGCESCHGPGGAHVEEGGGEGVGGIIPLGPKSPVPADRQNAVCLQCHTKGAVVMWSGSSHENRGLSCPSCHRMHGGYSKSLARATQTEVCIECHKRIKSELLRQSHHPIREGKIKCANCHNPHGTIGDKLVDAQYVNLKCFECHAEKRGPFLWEHQPVFENCLNCHTPHGSARNALLNAKAPYICQRCHSDAFHPGTLYARSRGDSGQTVYRVLNNRAFYRACLNCHVTIHGSNHPSGKSLLR